MSNTKWLPVATTARATTGPQSRKIQRSQGVRTAANSAQPTATANPTCSDGTAASSLKKLVEKFDVMLIPVCVVIVSAIPMSASRGGATGNRPYTGTDSSQVARIVLRSVA